LRRGIVSNRAGEVVFLMTESSPFYYVYLMIDGGLRWPLISRRILAAEEIPGDIRAEWVGTFANEHAAWEVFEKLIE
jgi:hypothetical protein